jgi:hypothetical protein
MQAGVATRLVEHKVYSTCLLAAVVSFAALAYLAGLVELC